MPDDFEIRGADAFLKLSKRLKVEGRGDLRRDLNNALKRTAKPLAVQGRAAVVSFAPRAGGLAKRIGKQPVGVQVRTGALTAGVRLTAGRKGSAMRALERGEVRHPVFGRPGSFVTQQVPSAKGAWEESIEGDKRQVQAALADAMSDVARRLTRGG